MTKSTKCCMMMMALTFSFINSCLLAQKMLPTQKIPKVNLIMCICIDKDTSKKRMF